MDANHFSDVGVGGRFSRGEIAVPSRRLRLGDAVEEEFEHVAGALTFIARGHMPEVLMGDCHRARLYR